MKDKIEQYRIGMYSNGKILFQIGNSVKCTYTQAAFVVMLFEKALKDTIREDTYIACEVIL